MERGKGKKRGRGAALGRRERRSLLQMAVSLLLFLLVFTGQEAFPEQTALWREELLGLMQRDTDFRRVFAYLGASVAEEAPVLETLDTVWTEVFGSGTLPMGEPDRTAVMALRLELRQENAALGQKPEPPAPKAEPEETPAEVRDPVLAAVRQDLGLEESLTPVMGILTSGYGVRVHPIDGETKMHDGVDLAAEEGTEIRAFSDGVVDYIGESKAYGMYLQLRHDNGVTTFYAHCSALCVQKGQRVKMGDVVARVGNTGVSTGPHLHLEMKKDGEFLDPQPYVRYLTG